MTQIDEYQDIIDVRDVIDAYQDAESDGDVPGDIAGLIQDLRGNGGDEQWRGDWYPLTLIRDSHFTEYAQELAEDIGAIPSDYSWPASHIDWDAATRSLQMDYSTVEYNGVLYWYR